MSLTYNEKNRFDCALPEFAKLKWIDGNEGRNKQILWKFNEKQNN